MGQSLFDGMTSFEQTEGKRALRKLGGENVDIELELDDVADAVEDTKLWLAANLGEARRDKLTLIAGTITYTLPKHVAVVVDVIPPGTHTSSEDVFDDNYSRRYSTHIYRRNGFFGATQVQDNMYDRMIDRTYNRDLAWEYDRRTRTLTVTPSTLSGISWYEYTVETVDVERLDAKAMSLFRRYLVATLKRLLGLVRRKYSEIPMGGAKVGLDGDSLSSDSEIEIAELNEEIRQMATTPPFLVG